MTNQIKLLAFAGSLRSESYNKKLVKIAAQGALAAGAEITFVDLKDLPMPIYDEDFEKAEGIHPNALKLKKLMMEHDGFLIASPEYNSSVSAALKNAIDWASRSLPGEANLACFRGKVAGIMSASPGALGGLRGLVHLRAILENIYVMVIPEQTAVVKAHEAFAADGSLNDGKIKESVERIGAKTASVIAALKAHDRQTVK